MQFYAGLVHLPFRPTNLSAEATHDRTFSTVGAIAPKYIVSAICLYCYVRYSLLFVGGFSSIAKCSPEPSQNDGRSPDSAEPRHAAPTNRRNDRYQLVDDQDTDDDIDRQDDAILPPFQLNSAARRASPPINCRLLLLVALTSRILLHAAARFIAVPSSADVRTSHARVSFGALCGSLLLLELVS